MVDRPATPEHTTTLVLDGSSSSAIIGSVKTPPRVSTRASPPRGSSTACEALPLRRRRLQATVTPTTTADPTPSQPHPPGWPNPNTMPPSKSSRPRGPLAMRGPRGRLSVVTVGVHCGTICGLENRVSNFPCLDVPSLIPYRDRNFNRGN